jgi:hypothetical protein
MKKTLVFAAVLFFVTGFLVSCSKKDRDKIINGDNQTQNFETQIPNDTMTQDEKETIKNTETLNSADYEICELRFGSNFVSAASQEFTIVNNAEYSFVFGLRNKDTGEIAYYTIQNSSWSFSSDNAKVSKKGNIGFSVSSLFYSDTNANIEMEITYKGISKTFSFVLKSGMNNPESEVIAYRIDLNTWQIFPEDKLVNVDLKNRDFTLLEQNDEDKPENFVATGDSTGHVFKVDLVLIIHSISNNKDYVLINPDLINFETYMSDTGNNSAPVKLDNSRYSISSEIFSGISFKQIQLRVTGENRQRGDKVFIDIRLLNITGVNNSNFQDKRMRRFTVRVD